MPEAVVLTINPLPANSVATDVVSVVAGSERIANIQLDGLANGASTPTLSYSNPKSVANATLFLRLDTLTPTAGGKILISNGTVGYEMALSTASTYRELIFNNIPTSFLSSFTITNNSGVALAPNGNFATVYVDTQQPTMVLPQ